MKERQQRHTPTNGEGTSNANPAIRNLKRTPNAIISAGKEIEKRWPTFLSCILVMIVLLGVGLSYAWIAGPKWVEGNRMTAMAVMSLILAIISLLSLWPMLMYLAFNRVERERIWEHIMSELRHYNMQQESLVQEIRKCLDNAYNPSTYRIPMLLATLTLMVGWVLFFFSQGPSIVTELATGRASVIFSRIENADPVVFGFLGAFFFSLGMLFQRYITSDLKASVFMHIAVRVWSVMILIMVLSAVWSWPERGLNLLDPARAPTQLLAASFIIGIFPNFGLDLIQRAARGIAGQLRGIKTRDIPLSKIRGLNLWHQARLAEEDIDSVQNLAMSDIVGLIANTRLGVMRLLDWVDRAILIIQMTEEDLKRFYAAGINTATEFESVYVGLLSEKEQLNFSERGEEQESYMGRRGPSHVPGVPPGLIKALGESKLEKGQFNALIKALQKDGQLDSGQLINILEKDEELEGSLRNALTEVLQKDEGLIARVRNMMIAICDDVNYQRLWKMRRGQLFEFWTVCFTLNEKSPLEVNTEIDRIVVAVNQDSNELVVHNVTATNRHEALRRAACSANSFLDALSWKEGTYLTIKSETASLETGGRVTLVKNDDSGTILEVLSDFRKSGAIDCKHSDAAKYYRKAHFTNDPFDSFHNLYLAIANIAEKIITKKQISKTQLKKDYGLRSYEQSLLQLALKVSFTNNLQPLIEATRKTYTLDENESEVVPQVAKILYEVYMRQQNRPKSSQDREILYDSQDKKEMETAIHLMDLVAKKLLAYEEADLLE